MKRRTKSIVTALTFAVILASSNSKSYAMIPHCSPNFHDYRHIERCYHSGLAYQHGYCDKNGEYKTCDIVGYYYYSYDQCTRCGYESRPYYWQVYEHMQCGQ